MAALMYTGLILFILTLIVNILAEWIVSQVRAKYNYKLATISYIVLVYVK